MSGSIEASQQYGELLPAPVNGGHGKPGGKAATTRMNRRAP